MSTRECAVDGCESVPRSSGATWCNPHYMRWYSTGDPLPRPKPTIEAAFWSRVDRTADCWVWTGAHSSAGYGQAWIGSRVQYAHRIAYEWLVGPIPDGLQIDHLCRNRTCVNPAHLEPVTPAENTRRGSPVTKAFCVNGHPRDEANTYVRPDRRGRQCRTCARERRRALSA